ncbi:MAG TPA: HAD-IB family hydrolase [Acidobacteriota bacterium]|nr:HAD-IB family hydrolase [Acidobacteriota bacterium]
MKFSGAAFFDVDGTLLPATVLHYYAFFRMQEFGPAAGMPWKCLFLLKAPYFWALDRCSRELFNRRFYRSYRRLRPRQVESPARELLEKFIRPRLFSEAIECVQRHRAERRAVVLVSGSIRQVVEPLAQFLQADHYYCAELCVENERFSGDLRGGPMTGERKAAAVVSFLRRHGLARETASAYADSYDDIPMLRAAGRAVAVNPEGKLRRQALEQGWEIVEWKRSDTSRACAAI